MIIAHRNETPRRGFTNPHIGPLCVPTSGILSKSRPTLTESVRGGTLLLPLDCADLDGHGSRGGAIAQIEEVGCLQRYPGRAPIFHHGDPATSVYIVRQGKLKLSLISYGGRCVVFRFAVPGDLLGLSAILNHTDHQFLTQTLEPSILVNVPRGQFLQLLQASPEVSSFATQALARDHDAMLRGIRRLGMSASVRQRLAQLLLTCLECSHTNCSPLSIRMNWRYGELAEMVNSSRETVTRLMSQFERENLIIRRGSLVIIRNQSKLQIVAGI